MDIVYIFHWVEEGMLNLFKSDSASLLLKLKVVQIQWQLNREYGDIGAVFIDAHYDPTDLMEADNFKKGKLSYYREETSSQKLEGCGIPRKPRVVKVWAQLIPLNNIYLPLDTLE